MVSAMTKKRPSITIHDQFIASILGQVADGKRTDRMRELVDLAVLVERLQGAQLIAATDQLRAAAGLVSTRPALAVALILGEAAPAYQVAALSDVPAPLPITSASPLIAGASTLVSGAPGVTIAVSPEKRESPEATPLQPVVSAADGRGDSMSVAPLLDRLDVQFQRTFGMPDGAAEEHLSTQPTNAVVAEGRVEQQGSDGRQQRMHTMFNSVGKIR